MAFLLGTRHTTVSSSLFVYGLFSLIFEGRFVMTLLHLGPVLIFPLLSALPCLVIHIGLFHVLLGLLLVSFQVLSLNFLYHP